MNLDEFINGKDFIDAISPLKEEIKDNSSIPLVGYLIGTAIKYYMLFKDTNYTNDDLYEYINQLATKYSTFRKKDYNYINYSAETRPGLKDFNNFLILKNTLNLYGLSYKDLNDDGVREKVYNFLDKSSSVEYMYHAFNASSEDSIIKYGLSNSKRLNSDDEVLMINNLFKSYGEYGILNNYESSSMGSFYYSKDPLVSYFYGLKSPEWFYMFCGGSHSYTKDERYVKDAYINRDYDACLNNINVMMDNLSFKEHDREIVTNFFNKYWDIFNRYEPRLLIIKDEYNNRGYYELEDEDYEMNPIEFTSMCFNAYNNEFDTNMDYPGEIDIGNAMIIGLPTHKEVIEKLHSKQMKKA